MRFVILHTCPWRVPGLIDCGRNARSVAKCMYRSSENDKRLTIVTNEEVCSSMNFHLVAFFGSTDVTDTT